MALDDFELIQFTPMKRISESIRQLAVITHNSAFGRRKKDQIKKPSQLWKFGWEETRVHIQSMEELTESLHAFGSLPGVKVIQRNPDKAKKKDD